MSKIAERVRHRLASSASKSAPVEREVPGWGMLRFRSITADEYLNAATSEGTGPWLRAIVAASLVDESGQPVLASPGELAHLTMDELRPLSDAACAANRIDLDAAKKNSTSGPSSASSSTSPNGSV